MTFYGTIFTAQGMKPDPLKIHALQDHPSPQHQNYSQWICTLFENNLSLLWLNTTTNHTDRCKWIWTRCCTATKQQTHHICFPNPNRCRNQLCKDIMRMSFSSLWIRKIHTYIYSRHITVYNDHKPLEMITKKPIHTALPRLQRMLLWLKRYDYTLL